MWAQDILELNRGIIVSVNYWRNKICVFVDCGYLRTRPHRGYAFTCCLEEFQKSPLLAKNFLNALVPQK